MTSSVPDDPRLVKGADAAALFGGIGTVERTNCPIVSPDGNVMYFNSTRKGTRTWARYDSASKRYDDDIYYITKLTGRNAGWSQPVNLGQQVNSGQDDGVAAISRDGQTAYFLSLRWRWGSEGGPFYHARIEGTKWMGIKGLGGGITQFFKDRDHSKRFRVYGASISPDGNDFYFATTANSKSDEHEIWMAHRDSNEVWQYPVNLGTIVNVAGGSFAPCIAADNRTLYFASRRAGGFGGDDIYVSRKENDGTWSEPRNLGPTINSARDEAFPWLDATGDYIYVSIGLKGREDFSTVPLLLPKEFRPSSTVTLSGMVTDKESGRFVEATIIIEDLKTGQKIFKASSDRINGMYSVVLQPGTDYGISISAPDYLFVSDRYTLPEGNTSDALTRVFELERLRQGERFFINNIFFEYNTASIRAESQPELGRLLGLLQKHPRLRIEISGHADSIGSGDYNRRLSIQRAESVKQYLLQSGIQTERVITRGFGATKPVAPNDTEAGRRQNRRTEFLVLEM